MIPYISLVLPSIGWQVPWGKLYAHPVSLGCVLSFEHMIWCTDSTWYCDLFPLIIYMTNKKMIQSSSRYMHDIYLANRKLRCKLWWMAAWHFVCFAFKDDWFACWLNIKLNSLWSHWLPWLSWIFLLSQHISYPYLSHSKGLWLLSSCHLPFPQMAGANIVQAHYKIKKCHS